MDAIVAERTVVREGRMRLIAVLRPVRVVPVMKVRMIVRAMIMAMRGSIQIVRRAALRGLVRAERCARTAPDDDQNRQQQPADTAGAQPQGL
jgi:type II secretory pathway component PulK